MSIDQRKYADCREYLIKAVKTRQKILKENAIKYKGGKCNICGYNKCMEALDFHYLSGKDFGISLKGYTRS